MRLAVTVMWCLGAVLWCAWLLVAIRLAISLSLGEGWNNNPLVTIALVGPWPKYGLLRWTIESWYPIEALLGCALVGAGWRIYWWDQDGILTRPAWLVALSVVLPPVAPLIMWGDARRRHAARELELESAVEDARERLNASS